MDQGSSHRRRGISRPLIAPRPVLRRTSSRAANTSRPIRFPLFGDAGARRTRRTLGADTRVHEPRRRRWHSPCTRTSRDSRTHFLAGEFDVDGLADRPAVHECRPVDRLPDPGAAVLRQRRSRRDELVPSCGEDTAPWVDSLGDVDLPALYVSAAGGFGLVYEATLDRMTSADVSMLTVSLHPPEEIGAGLRAHRPVHRRRMHLSSCGSRSWTGSCPGAARSTRSIRRSPWSRGNAAHTRPQSPSARQHAAGRNFPFSNHYWKYSGPISRPTSRTGVRARSRAKFTQCRRNRAPAPAFPSRPIT